MFRSSYTYDNDAHDVGTRNFSLGFWVKMDTTAATVPIGKHNLSGSRSVGYNVLLNYLGTGKIYFAIGDSSNVSPYSQIAVNTAAGAIDTGAWHHITLVRSTLTTVAGLKIYVDGSPVSTSTFYSGPLTTGNLSNSTGLKIGSRYPYTPSTFDYNGRLSDVRMYLKALSDSEISDMYSGCSWPTDSLVYHIPLNEKTGDPEDIVNDLVSTESGSGMTIETDTLPIFCHQQALSVDQEPSCLCKTFTIRVSAPTAYRYGFNGKENDNEWGDHLIQDYGFRMYNPAIGKFLSVDPLSQDFPWYTPYQFAGNRPIWAIDLDGLEDVKINSPYVSTNLAKQISGLAAELSNPTVMDVTIAQSLYKVGVMAKYLTKYEYAITSGNKMPDATSAGLPIDFIRDKFGEKVITSKGRDDDRLIITGTFLMVDQKYTGEFVTGEIVNITLYDSGLSFEENREKLKEASDAFGFDKAKFGNGANGGGMGTRMNSDGIRTGGPLHARFSVKKGLVSPAPGEVTMNNDVSGAQKTYDLLKADKLPDGHNVVTTYSVETKTRRIGGVNVKTTYNVKSTEVSAGDVSYTFDEKTKVE